MDFFADYRKAQRRNNSCAKGCSSTTNKNRNWSFHAVPKRGVEIERQHLFDKTETVDKRAEWLKKLCIADSSGDLFVCSSHFKSTDYHFPDVTTGRRLLRKNAIPILKSQPDKYKQREAAIINREERSVRRSINKENYKTRSSIKVEKQTSMTNAGSVDNASESKTDHVDSNKEVFAVDESNIDDILNSVISPSENSKVVVVEPEYHDDGCEELQEKMYLLDINQSELQEFTETVSQDKTMPINSVEDKSVQVNIDNFIINISSHIKSESDLIAVCNIKSFRILDEVTRLMDEIYPRKRKYLINTRDSIILTMAKLKLDISFSALAVLFNSVTEVTIRHTFYDTVRKQSTIMQCVLGKVTKEEIRRNMPLCFERFQDTTSVLDCTEVKIQTPKCLKCKLNFYSHYKSHLTVKFMTEVTPAGLITFVIESFGGRASDKAIFNYSGTLKHMESRRDAVMVDRGFLIDDECLQRQIKLIRPPYLKNKLQFTELEAIHNKEVASARVHIEGVNQRIKLFQILNHKFPWHMIDYVDDIFIICCGFANLDSPILADDKFKKK